MNHNEFQHIAEQLFGKAVWVAFAYLGISIFKGLILNVYEGLMVFLGNDLNADDVVYLGPDERPARIVRMGIRKTVFYMKDQDGRWNIKMAVPNESLKTMVIKKQLPKNGGRFHSITGSEDGQ
jgi:hypothetical protein|tara:strand:+ start:463 stop:831 length:369 start_codon:yes stop_codon:yes gene_type:complete